jgi:hypothetical protein
VVKAVAARRENTPFTTFTGFHRAAWENCRENPTASSRRPRQTFFATGSKKGGKGGKGGGGAAKKRENTTFTPFTGFHRPDCGNCRANRQPCPAADPCDIFRERTGKRGKRR